MSGFIGTLVGLIFVLIIMGVVWWAIQQLLPLIPIGEPFRRIIYVLMMVILVLVVLWVILVLLGVAGVHVPGPFRGA
jgi:peptidoglycan biosynthesis protein MviN/MurJ (putative lipid II flippase)